MIRDKYPIPNIEDQIEQLAESRVFTTLDLENSYFHVPIDEDSRKFTAFVTHERQYEFCRAPFGLCSSGNVFCRFINSALRELINEGVIITFVDDIIIPAKSEQDGIASLKREFEMAEKAGLRFNWKKCVFLQRRVEYLGYVVYDGRIEPAEQQIEKVKRYPQPKTTKQLQRFIGLASYFRKFIPGFAKIARPLTMMLKKENQFDFGIREIAAFEEIKSVFVPVLYLLL